MLERTGKQKLVAAPYFGTVMNMRAWAQFSAPQEFNFVAEDGGELGIRLLSHR